MSDKLFQPLSVIVNDDNNVLSFFIKSEKFNSTENFISFPLSELQNANKLKIEFQIEDWLYTLCDHKVFCTLMMETLCLNGPKKNNVLKNMKEIKSLLILLEFYCKLLTERWKGLYLNEIPNYPFYVEPPKILRGLHLNSSLNQNVVKYFDQYLKRLIGNSRLEKFWGIQLAKKKSNVQFLYPGVSLPYLNVNYKDGNFTENSAKQLIKFSLPNDEQFENISKKNFSIFLTSGIEGLINAINFYRFPFLRPINLTKKSN